MEDISLFKNHVVRHAQTLSDDQRQVYLNQCRDGECVTISMEVYRGHLGRATLAEFVDNAASRNGIRPEDYFTGWLNTPHEIIATLSPEDTGLEQPAPIYFFPGNGVYAVAVSETEVIDVWMSWPCYPENW